MTAGHTHHGTRDSRIGSNSQPASSCPKAKFLESCNGWRQLADATKAIALRTPVNECYRDVTPTDSPQRLCSCSLPWSERGFYDLRGFISSIHGFFLRTVPPKRAASHTNAISRT